MFISKKKVTQKNLGLNKINTHYVYINERSKNFIKVTRKRKKFIFLNDHRNKMTSYISLISHGKLCIIPHNDI